MNANDFYKVKNALSPILEKIHSDIPRSEAKVRVGKVFQEIILKTELTGIITINTVLNLSEFEIMHKVITGKNEMGSTNNLNRSIYSATLSEIDKIENYTPEMLFSLSMNNCVSLYHSNMDMKVSQDLDLYMLLVNKHVDKNSLSDDFDLLSHLQEMFIVYCLINSINILTGDFDKSKIMIIPKEDGLLYYQKQKILKDIEKFDVLEKDFEEKTLILDDRINDIYKNMITIMAMLITAFSVMGLNLSIISGNFSIVTILGVNLSMIFALLVVFWLLNKMVFEKEIPKLDSLIMDIGGFIGISTCLYFGYKMIELIISIT